MFKTCCCYFSLRTGVLVIGTIGVIFWAFGVGLNIYNASNHPNDYLDEGVIDERSPELLIATIWYASLNILTAGMLLQSAIMRNRVLLLPGMMVFVFTTGYVIFYIFREPKSAGLFPLVAVPSIYQFLVVYSYYKELKQQQMTTNIPYAEQVDDPERMRVVNSTPIAA